MLRPAAAHSFDNSLNRWRAAVGARKPEPFVSLRVCSWNMWFSDQDKEDRCEALFQCLESKQPDVIALQEVTFDILPTILNIPWVQESYVVSDITGGTLGEYGLLLLTKPAIRIYHHQRLPSVMRRSFLACDLAFADRVFTVATTHLESLSGNLEIRRTQLATVQEFLRGKPNDSLIVGDFNIKHDESIDDLLGEFSDCWQSVRPDDPGYTRDPLNNPYNTKKKTKQERLDRMLLRSVDKRVSPKTIELLGCSAVETAIGPIFPSDHFGLLVDLHPC